MARRASRRRSAGGAGVQQLPWQQVENHYRPIEVLSDDQLEAICDAAYRILEQVGMDFLHDGAKTLFRQAGAEVSGERVRIERGLIREALAKAPSTVKLRARNPAHDLHFGAGRVAFGSVASAPNASDIERGRRSGNQQDFQNFLKLISVAEYYSLYRRLPGRAGRPGAAHPPPGLYPRHGGAHRQGLPRLFFRPRADQRRAGDHPHRSAL